MDKQRGVVRHAAAEYMDRNDRPEGANSSWSMLELAHNGVCDAISGEHPQRHARRAQSPERSSFTDR